MLDLRTGFHMKNIIYLFIIGILSGCGNTETKYSSVIAPLSCDWPKTKDGIVVNWLGNMVINDKEYFPIKHFNIGNIQNGQIMIKINLDNPPVGFGEVKIIPSIRFRKSLGGNTMYEIKVNNVIMAHKDTLEYSFKTAEIPESIINGGHNDIICEIGYYYDEKYKCCAISNVINDK
jgi:hypothetical protein